MRRFLLMALGAQDGTEAQAVKQADEALSQASDGLRRHLPSSWKEEWLFGLDRWQWVAMVVLGAIIALTTVALVRMTARLVQRANAQQSASQQSFIAELLHHVSNPMALGWAALLSRIALPMLDLSSKAEGLWQRGFRITLTVALFWGSLRAVTAISEHFVTGSTALSRPGSRALIGLFSRVGRFALIGLAILATFTELGYSVGSVLAGLGIGGIALALGAQKTLENVFGAFALAVDQPIREGDFVRVESTLGTVESIGLRSTRIRTLERTVVTIPNGKLADLNLETFAARDRIRLATTLGLSVETNPSQMKVVLEHMREILSAHPKVWPEGAAVRLVEVTAMAQQIEIVAWIATTDFDEFKAIREALLLGFLQVIEKAGARLAIYPRSPVTA